VPSADLGRAPAVRAADTPGLDTAGTTTTSTARRFMYLLQE
jgi:hypothetical protein